MLVNQLGTWGTTTRLQVPEAALSASRDQVAEKGFRNNIPRGRASQGQKPAGQQQRRAQTNHPGGETEHALCSSRGKGDPAAVGPVEGKAPAAAGGGSLPAGALSPGAGRLPV